MSNASELWPLIVIAGLGVYHGVNPAMGWLFAVALGLHRGSQRAVALSLVPIALGHLGAVAAVVAAFLLLGQVLDRTPLARLAACVLLGWALAHRKLVVVGVLLVFAGSLALYPLIGT